MERQVEICGRAALLLLLLPVLVHGAGPQVSAALTSIEGPVLAVVQFNAAIAAGEPDRILKEAGVRVLQNPDLLPNDRLVETSADGLAALSGIPDVLYVYPASMDVIAGVPVRGCAGSLSAGNDEAEFLFYAIGGWYNVLPHGAPLYWNFGHPSRQFSQAVLRPIFERAFAEWSRTVQLSFQYAPGAVNQAVTIEFFSGAHGDPYPFTGRGGTMAHGFYPPPGNQEPIAGDLHLDDDETWTDGGDPDLYSVALHEIGHALGLMHSGTPGTVMYPYYRNLDKLQEEDIQDLQRFFPARPEALAGPPLVLDVATPTAVTTETVDISGTLAGMQGAADITWQVGSSTGRIAGASNWTVRGLPLKLGVNQTTFAASDSAGRHAAKSIVVIRNAVAPPSTDTIAPSLTIQAPSTSVFGTSADKLRISGVAKDNVGVKEVIWQCGSATGTASGTINWSIDLPLKVGDNQIIVRAKDAAGNMGWRSLLVTRR